MNTTTATNTENHILLNEQESFSAVAGNHSSFLNEIRTQAAARFNEMGIPSAKHEEWKYVPLAVLTKINFKAIPPTGAFKLSKADAERFRIAGKEAVLVVIENGRLNKNASNVNGLPKGVTIGSLADLAADPRVKLHLTKHAETEHEPFVALNTAMLFDAAIVLIDEAVIFDRPIQLIHLSDGEHHAVAVAARTLVVAGKNSQCAIVESYHTLNDRHAVFTHAVSEVVVGENAKMQYAKIQDERENAHHISYHKINQSKNSEQHIHTITLGGALVRNNLNICLDDVNCSTYLNGLYILNGTQVVDNHTLVDHAKPHCYSNELYKGIIDGKAQGVFNGKIFVRKDAQKTNAYQSNKNILLSNDASMNAKPQLEIYADDVKCSHGATTAQPDGEALFYLRARGIGETNAKALLNHAFAADVIGRIEMESLKESLLEMLSRKLLEH